MKSVLVATVLIVPVLLMTIGTASAHPWGYWGGHWGRGGVGLGIFIGPPVVSVPAPVYAYPPYYGPEAYYGPGYYPGRAWIPGHWSLGRPRVWVRGHWAIR